ncbi:MAG: GSCFA domain-containing protein [Spirochaetales bacterium]|uniref:GSCFA domain-containing protein n=1 Tax=Candidatus Thalassospirochaeta sargassi TaxID=3119039 RepID=A0AAJ1IG96_9SPIO|nr:GSCFA domain-containing protein [Spirochaetales bacterium]
MKRKPALIMISLSSDGGRSFYADSITPVSVPPPAWRLRGEGMFFIGSCFADYLYNEYESAELNAAASPFGNIYNPESLAEATGLFCGSAEKIKAEDCFSTTGGDKGESGEYRHFMFHSRIHASDANGLANLLNAQIEQSRSYLRSAESAVITLGTSLVYRLKNGQTVNNCHKLPAANFDRVQLSVDESAAALKRIFKNLRQLNPELRFIITLSPVRHLRDNAAENSLSKAVLRCAIDRLCDIEPDSCWYFPSYEIMLDELRDYRWYANDLCHPSDTAVSYIISRFIESAYEKDFKEFLKNYSRIIKDLKHKPYRPGSEEFKRFRARAEEKKAELKRARPELFNKN